MYICVCKAVTDRQIKQATREGACSLRDLTRELGLGTGCGKCVPAAREVLGACLMQQGAAQQPEAAPANQVWANAAR
ncbi:MAG: bacterioferritin-associated ferredoxin [Pseudomonadota bacterium]